MKTIFSILGVGLFFWAMFTPVQTHAFTWDKNNIISNSELTKSGGMSVTAIKNFLQQKDSGLYGLKTTDADGDSRNVANIIYDTAQKYTLSPQFFLVMLQKEAGLVSSSDPSKSALNWALGYGVCDGCDKSDPAVSQYKGFGNQLDSAGDRVRNSYLADLIARGYTVSGWGPGIKKTTSDGIKVTPDNNATAVLYTYNPWVGAYGGGDSRYGANSLFGKLWQEWFPNKYYPNGSLLQSEDTLEVYLIEDGMKFRFDSLTALYINYNPERIIVVPNSAIEKYTTGGVIKFPNYSLLRSPGGTVYLYVDGLKRGIVSTEILRQLGFNPEEIIDVSWTDINKIPDGENITSANNLTGVLLQDSSTGGVFYIDNDKISHPIWSRLIMDSQFRGWPIHVVSNGEIKSYKEGKPVKFKDGTLIASDGYPSVYVVSNGRRRPILSGEVFEEYGYSWNQIIFVPEQLLLLHPKGLYLK